MDKLYTTNQLAKLFGVVPTTVIDWIERGKLDAFKTLGGHRRITNQAVLDFLHRHRLPYPPAFADSAPKIVLLIADGAGVNRAWRAVAGLAAAGAGVPRIAPDRGADADRRRTAALVVLDADSSDWG